MFQVDPSKTRLSGMSESIKKRNDHIVRVDALANLSSGKIQKDKKKMSYSKVSTDKHLI